MIERQEDKIIYYCSKIRQLIYDVSWGQKVVFDPPVRMRLTPHTPTVYINEVNSSDKLEEMEEEKLTSIMQRLMYLKTYK